MSGCLDGVKIIELGHVVVMPSAAAILADWGADVIKVEAPVVGDQTRGIKRLEGGEFITGGIHFIFEVMNRNKRGITLNLKHEKGREIMCELVKKSDVFMSNFQLQSLTNLGLDYQNLNSLNPQLIYATVSGYGNKGPSKDKPGYDYAAFWANSGIMDKLGSPENLPCKMRPGIGDNVTSMCIAGGISAALFAREKTGMGQELSFSLYNTGVWTLQTDIQVALSKGEELPYGDVKKSVNPLWNAYQTKDGRWILLCMLQSDPFWPRFCRALELEHIENDPRFESSQAREENCEALISVIGDVFGSRNLVELEEILEKNNLFFSRVQTISEVVSDPQALENDFFTEVEHPSGHRIKLIASPILFNGARPKIKSHAPELGQHTEEVLLDLGYAWDDIGLFKDNGII